MKGALFTEHPEAENMYQYTDHVVALLDILGFSKLVDDSKLNAVFYGALSAISRMPSMKSEYKKIGIQNLKTSILSDSIVLSYPQEVPNCFEMLIRTVDTVMTTFVNDNIVLRGAITAGPLFHQNGIVFGPALLKAYMLEENVAFYPRCIVDPENIELLFNQLPVDNDTGISFPIDSDGIHYYNYFLQALYVAHQEQSDFRTEKIQRLRELIANNIKKYQEYQHNTRILQKYLWMKEHFNAALPLISDMVKDSALHLAINK